MGDNYLSTAFKTYNTNFFTFEVIELVQKSPEWLIYLFVWLFCISCLFMLIGLLSYASCLAMTVSCYYFYALNSFHVGTLSWDILLVTLFLMCVTPYHGDYFSLDALIWGNNLSYKKKRPYFLQRLLQLQVAFTFFYTALYKVSAKGNWLTDNPIYYLVNNPPAGVTKAFLLKDYLMDKPQLCFVIGVSIIVVEFLMIFLLYYQRTRISAIYLGVFFHIILVLTLDVPAIFFFLFPPQLLLFIDPEKVVGWIDQKRKVNIENRKHLSPPLLIYDGHCQFCVASVEKLKVMDLYATLNYSDLHKIENLPEVHPKLNKDLVMSQLQLLESNGVLFGGFFVFRRICFTMPMLYPLIPILYFPGMGILGPLVYQFIAKNRYLLHFNKTCENNACFR